jgi:hydrogenase maturation protease
VSPRSADSIRARVLGLGNVLMGDDGLGPRVLVELAARYEFPPSLELVEIGTPGLDLIPYLGGLDYLLVIDCVNADAVPGSLRRYDRDEILNGALDCRLGPHDPTLKEALLTAEFADDGPGSVTLIGAVPASQATGAGLSSALLAALPELETQVLAELTTQGYPGRPRSRPRAPDVWWEREEFSSRKN